VCLFGEVTDGEMVLSAAGRMLVTEWNSLPDRFPMIELDAFVVMPNHVHNCWPRLRVVHQGMFRPSCDRTDNGLNLITFKGGR